MWCTFGHSGEERRRSSCIRIEPCAVLKVSLNAKLWRSPFPSKKKTNGSMAISPTDFARIFRLPRTSLKKCGKRKSGHRRRLIELYQARWGDHLPLIRRQDVKGFVNRKPVWLIRPLPLDTVRRQAASMELETQNFYRKAAARDQRRGHPPVARRSGRGRTVARRQGGKTGRGPTEHRRNPHGGETNRRLFVLQIVQPGLAGLMDGSVSTLAPVFAAAVATQKPYDAFLVGLAASVGAGISMGFAEALSDDGSLTGRGQPLDARAGVRGHDRARRHRPHAAVPAVQFQVAMTAAIAVVLVELGIITWIRQRYMDTPIWSAALQVGFGGALVFATGILIGSS